MLVKEITGDSTIEVRGLDLQLFWKLNQLVPNSLVSISDLNIKLGEGCFPYCQLPSRNALKYALNAHKKPLTINSAYRSVVSQAVLYSQKKRGLIKNPVAYPGHSDHQKGASLDVEEWQQVIDLMQQHGWAWTYGQNDAMHFDCTSSKIRDIRTDSIKAFQKLWNIEYPTRKISVDGILGQETLKCIYDSPREGFANVGYPRFLMLTNPLQQGMDVGRLQIALRNSGIKLDKATEVFDEATEQAVKDFQASKGLTPNGIVSQEVHRLLRQSDCSLTHPPIYISSIDKCYIPLPGVELIKRFEGFSSKAYVDPASGGEPITIGYGCTVKADGCKWRLGDTITEESASELLLIQLKTQYLPSLEKIPVWKELNINQRGAILSFAYNLGRNFYGSPNFGSITRMLRDKEWFATPAIVEETFIKYCNPGSSVESGLRKRRIAEAKLFASPVCI